ncbi:hypothetical protein LguiA_036124 [Lonicera macranthoides]
MASVAIRFSRKALASAFICNHLFCHTLTTESAAKITEYPDRVKWDYRGQRQIIPLDQGLPKITVDASTLQFEVRHDALFLAYLQAVTAPLLLLLFSAKNFPIEEVVLLLEVRHNALFRFNSSCFNYSQVHKSVLSIA